MARIDDFIQALTDEMLAVTRQATRGEIDVARWETEMQGLIRAGTTGAEMIGRGTRPLNLLERVLAWFRRRGRIAQQFEYLRGFADEVRAGLYDPERLLPALDQRLKLYANAVRRAYGAEKLREAKHDGHTEKRRVLEPGAEHCDDCLNQAALGWVEIEDPRITEIGETECGANDRCEIETR